MAECIISMPYIGKHLSINHYKYRGKYTRPEVREWMDALAWLIKARRWTWRAPLQVRVDGYFRDKRATPDLANLSKVILDAIQVGTGINDKHMRYEDGEVGKGNPPYLRITITGGNDGKAD